MDPLYAFSCLLPSGFTSNFRLYDYYIRVTYILLCHLCSIPPVFCSSLIILWVFRTWYRLLYIYLLLYACAHDTIFNASLWFGFIDTRVLIYAHHLALASPLAGEFWLPWILMYRSQSLEHVNFPVADLRGAAVALISSRLSEALSFQSPCASLEFFHCKLVSAICTVHTCTSLCILVFAPIGDVIFL